MRTSINEKHGQKGPVVPISHVVRGRESTPKPSRTSCKACRNSKVPPMRHVTLSLTVQALATWAGANLLNPKVTLVRFRLAPQSVQHHCVGSLDQWPARHQAQQTTCERPWKNAQWLGHTWRLREWQRRLTSTRRTRSETPGTTTATLPAQHGSNTGLTQSRAQPRTIH